MRSSLLVTSIGSLLLVACGGLNEDDSRLAFASTFVALGQGQAQAQAQAATGAPAQAGDGVAFREGAAGQVDYTWNCLAGGTARFTGSAEAVSDAGGTAANFTLVAAFEGCNVNGITISGDLDYAASVTVDAAAVTTALTMKGDLTYEGDVDGACEFDLTLKVGATVGAGAGNAYGEFSGSLCGHKAGAVF